MKRKRGRPSKLTLDVHTKIVQAVQLGNYRKTAARYAGVSYSQFSVWMAKGARANPNPKPDAKPNPFRALFEAVENAEVEGEVLVVGDLLAKAKRDPKLAKWWLSHRHRKRWSDNQTVNHKVSGPDGGPVQIEDARAALDRRLGQLKARREAAKKKKGGTT